MKSFRLSGVAAFAALCFAIVMVGAGCGGGDSTTDSSGSGSGSAPDQGQYKEMLANLYKGTYTAPTGGPFQAPKGKNVWVISTGQNIETAQNASKGIEAAGGALGWKTTIVDGQFDSSRQLNGIQQAIADKADGIILLYIDCAPVKSGLEQAKAAGVALVAIEGTDCSPSVFDHVVTYAGDESFEDWIVKWGKAQAEWLVAMKEGKANALVSVQTDLETTRLAGQGSMEVFDECSECEAEELGFVGSEFGPKLQQKITDALLKNPNVDSFLGAYDAVLASGGAQALESSGRDILSMGGEGSAPGIKLIREDRGMNACVGIPTAQEGWSAVDGIARLLAGKDPAESNSGIGIQACDAEHNMPKEGAGFEAPVDYEAVFKQHWGIG
jgi:ribose transport system substrate-binding protein